MATYKTIELINRLSELVNNGYEYVDLSIIEADEDLPEALHFDAIESDACSVDYEEIDSVEIPEDYDYDNGYHKVNGSDFCLTLPFTYDEIGALAHAVENALQFVKECSDDPSCTKEDIADMKNAAIRWRNLQAKFAKFHKRFRKS